MPPQETTPPNQGPLPTSPADLFALLHHLGISYSLHHHPPIFTVAEGEHLKAAIPGVHCRNLFLRDKKKSCFLVMAANETSVDLKTLEKKLGCGRLSFGSPERLWETLGIRPGSVCPFTLVNDKDRVVHAVLDQHMMEADIVNYHPLDNAMTIGLTPADLLKFIAHTGHNYRILELSSQANTL